MATVGLALACVCGGPLRADAQTAPTPDERYATSLYLDLLLREPTPAEVSSVATALGSGTSKATVVAGLVDSTEFAIGWVRNSYFRYLDRAPTSTEQGAGVTITTGSGGFYNMEKTLLISSEYHTKAGGTNDAYVAALYQAILYRAGSPSEITYWSNRLTVGTSTRSAVVSTFVRGSEGSRKRVAGDGTGVPCASTTLGEDNPLASGSFCIILNRPADPSGQTYWTGVLSGTGELPDLWKSLASANEYYTFATT